MSAQGGSRPRAETDYAGWFRLTPREAIRDLFAVYEEHLEHIEKRTLDWLKGHSELGPRARERMTLPAERLEQTRARVRAAAQDDFAPLHTHLEEQAREQAEAGISLGAAYEDARAFTRELLPCLLRSYLSDSLRLGAALQAMSDLGDQCARIAGEAYVAQRDTGAIAREDDLAVTLDSIGDAVIVTDATGLITRVNPVAERLTGFSRAECLQRRLDDVFKIEHEESGESVESPVARVLREGMIVGLANQTVLVARDGTRRPIADSGAPIRHDETGNIRGVVLVFRDVSEQRQAEEALRHWERLFQHATWGVGVARASDVKIEAVNPAYAAMHGYTVAELLGQPVSLLWAPETQADMERHAHETRDHARLVAETTHLRKDGTRLPVEVIGTVVKDKHGKPTHFVANVQDITERKRLQQSQMRAIELEAENRRIEEANRMKSEFLANMSHELRTPLNSIIGFAELLHDEQVGSIEATQKEFLGDILAGGLHLLRLINDVLDLAKVEAGKMEFVPEAVDLATLVQTVIAGLFAAKGKQLEILVSVDPSLANVELDPGRFTQILHNYVSNALKFTPSGGTVEVRVVAEGSDRFRLEVEDTGPGVPLEDRARLFLPFQQLDSGIARRHGGTGLGLALTKRLAEAQGGAVGMRAASSGGSVFFAVLPRRSVVSTGTARRADVPSATQVLVVEQGAEDREILVGILKDAGYAVDAVATAGEAIICWQKRSYDAVTLSALTPGGDDLRALLELVRNTEGRSHVPVIALAVVADEHAAAGFAVTDMLTKPVNAGELLESLERGGAPPARGRQVLIVDDDPSSLRLMEATLAKLGYTALCFSSGADALVALERVRPVAIVLDLLMPSMDGFVFLERLRSAPESAEIPVMIWTVKDLSPEERRHLRSDAQAIVQKGAGDELPLSAVVRGFLPHATEQKAKSR